MTEFRRHVILTGELQVGKSTIVNAIASMPGVLPGGFATHFDGRENPERKLIISPSCDQSEGRAVIEFRGENPPRILANVFDGYGVDLLTARNQHCNLIIMDECGRFESQAHRFQNAVVSMLDGDKPVLGVMRQLEEPGWLEQLIVHPKASIVQVTPDNRTDLLQRLQQYYRSILNLG